MKEDEEKLSETLEKTLDGLSPKARVSAIRLYNLAYETGRRIARRKAYLAKTPRQTNSPGTDTQEDEKYSPE
ncbi:MAG: hypothetical protein ABFD70_05840 [Syntrophaceae bacterium]|nr:hypothetical protein [Deltaproteobacteria bacterium]